MDLAKVFVPKVPASFEPAIDYIVFKIPRFNFDKFSKAKKQLSSILLITIWRLNMIFLMRCYFKHINT